MSANEIKVWDPVVRLFHWILVTAFIIAFATEDELMGLHSTAGYTVAALLVLRIVWGLVGTRHARFSDFVFRPRVVVDYVKDTLLLRAKRYLGHNPAGGAMILLMLVSLVVTSATGLAVYGAEEHAGPLAGMMAGTGHGVEDALEETHEFFANFTLVLAVIHVAGVLLESLVHRENLVRAMWTGRKRA